MVAPRDKPSQTTHSRSDFYSTFYTTRVYYSNIIVWWPRMKSQAKPHILAQIFIQLFRLHPLGCPKLGLSGVQICQGVVSAQPLRSLSKSRVSVKWGGLAQKKIFPRRLRFIARCRQAGRPRPRPGKKRRGRAAARSHHHLILILISSEVCVCVTRAPNY